jgi:hypothetical protein
MKDKLKIYTVYMKIPNIERFDSIDIECDEIQCLENGAIVFYRDGDLLICFANENWVQVIKKDKQAQEVNDER